MPITRKRAFKAWRCIFCVLRGWVWLDPNKRGAINKIERAKRTKTTVAMGKLSRLLSKAIATEKDAAQANIQKILCKRRGITIRSPQVLLKLKRFPFYIAILCENCVKKMKLFLRGNKDIRGKVTSLKRKLK
tara:strand:- start:1556 stop:1951 length:396 start_codon:yes stop_codon:yes gene_type:complete